MKNNNDDIDALRQAAIEKNLSFGVTRLREQYRMKPKAGATPAMWVKSRYQRGVKNPTYYVKDCVAIKQSEPTQAQIIGRTIAGIKSKLRTKAYATARMMHDLINDKYDDLVILDTETTGLDCNDQIIELAIINMRGDTLFDRRFKPSVAINPDAAHIHGIDHDALIDCDSWPAHHASIANILKNKTVLIFNKRFDVSMMYQTAIAFNCDASFINDFDSVCIMYAAADFYGATNRYGTISLSNAAAAAGLSWSGKAHTAISDCEMTRRVAIAIADEYKHLIDKLNDAKSKKTKWL